MCFLSSFAQLCTVSPNAFTTYYSAKTQNFCKYSPQWLPLFQRMSLNYQPPGLPKLLSLISQLSEANKLCFGFIFLCLQYGNCHQPEVWGDYWDHLVVSNLLVIKILFHLLTDV